MLRRLFSPRSVDKKKYVKLRRIAHLYESGNSDIRTKFIKRYVLSEDISRIFGMGYFLARKLILDISLKMTLEDLF